jgi:ascorbate-specific PTS system EIIC-type component UlaA
MNSVVGAFIAGFVGALLAVVLVLSVVSGAQEAPDPVDKPLVSYGDR